MENLELKNVVNNNLDLFNNRNIKISNNAFEFQNIVSSAINSGVNYLLKSLDINENTRIQLEGMVSELKRKDFKEIIKDSITSSIKSGLEITNNNEKKLDKLENFKEISIKGGLNTLLTAGVDIVFNKFFKGNIMGSVLKVFSKGVRNFLLSNSFIQKINSGILRFKNKVNKFNNLCNDWYKVYKDFDLDKINDVYKQISNYKSKVNNSYDCIKQANIIENMTKFVNEKREKLSNNQLEICKSI